MADKLASALTELLLANIVDADWFVVHDVSAPNELKKLSAASVIDNLLTTADISGRAALALSAASGANDRFLIWDASATAIKQVTASEILNNLLSTASIAGLSALAIGSVDATNDRFLIWDASGTDIKQLTASGIVNNLLTSSDISGLTQITKAAVDTVADDFLVFDESATAFKKLASSEIFGSTWPPTDISGLGTITEATIDGANDEFLVFDASGSAMTRLTASEIVNNLLTTGDVSGLGTLANRAALDTTNDKAFIWDNSATAVKTAPVSALDPVDGTNVLEWANVVGDGVTDDTAAINTGLAALTGGERVIFPAGYTFKVGNLTMTSTDDVVFYGYGATLVGPGPSTGYALTLTTCDNCRVFGFKFDRLRSTEATANNGVSFLGCNGGEVAYCNFWDVQYGVAISNSGATISENIRVHSNDLTARVAVTSANKTANKLPDYIAAINGGSEHITIANNVAVGAQFMICNGADRNITVANNLIKNGHDSAIYIGRDCVGATVTGNVLERPGKDGIKVVDDASQVTVSGNTINGVSYIVSDGVALNISNCTNVSVVGNVVNIPAMIAAEVQRAAMIRSAQDIAFIGNVIEADAASSDSRHAIEIDDNGSDGAINTQRVTVSNNVIRNPRGRGITLGVQNDTFELSDIIINNNVIVGTNTDMDYGIGFTINALRSFKRVRIMDNIIRGWNSAGIYIGGGGTYEDITISGNYGGDPFNSGREFINALSMSGTVTRFVVENNQHEGISNFFEFTTAADEWKIIRRNNLAAGVLVDEKERDLGNSGSSIDIDWSRSDLLQTTLTASPVTFTFTAPIGGRGTLYLSVIQDASGSRTVTWPGSVQWAGGTAPTLSTGVNDVDVFRFYYDGSAVYYGETVGLNMSV